MRKLVVNTFMTLDGVAQAPGGPDEDTEGGFRFGGWSMDYWDDMMGQVMDAITGVPYDLLLGRKTYEIFAGYWPNAEDPMAEQLNAATKYVASNTLAELPWGPSELLKGDVAAEVARLKAGDGPMLLVYGSEDLIQTLLATDLIDDFHIWTYPLVLGQGKRLFAEGTRPRGLQLTDSKTSSTGVIIATYKLGGPLRPSEVVV